MDFKLIPLYDTQAIIKNWAYISEGMEQVLVYTENDTSLTKILNKLLSGQMLLWIAFVDNIYSGFLTTEIVDYPDNTGITRSLWICQLYAKPFLSEKIWKEGIEIIQKYAEQMNCNNIRFWTKRDKGWEKKLESEGFKRGYTEFIKNLKKEV